ncbi:hypothetical protein H2204_010836 [Knufia peltigerae]|nr:hypothetical protein H2204_010836 [Knufia peltigerae]
MEPSALLRCIHINRRPNDDLAPQTHEKEIELTHSPHLLLPPEDMNSQRKFSYASVKEEQGEGVPQSFESSLSSRDLEEVEWIAWPCSHWCRTKGLCSYHFGGSHDEYIRTRLEGYARSNPRKLEKILDELDKRRAAQKLFNLPDAKEITQFHPRPASFSLEVWREKVRDAVGTHDFTLDNLDETAIIDDDDTLSQTSCSRPASYLESMPIEILEMILSRVTVDHTADPYARPHVDLASCSLVCKKLYAAAVRVMYRHVSIPQSRAFSKLMRSLNNDKSLGELVHWLDFSHYSNMGFGKARSARNQTPFLKPETLLACLDMIPNLQAFLVHEHVDDELDVDIFRKLFSMPLLQALDLCACSSRPFADAFTNIVTQATLPSALPSLQRVSLHECTTLQEEVFEALLPRLTNLTHLDVAHTLINDTALLSIPPTAKITHLNIERCTHLTGSAVVDFLTTHPAVKDSIVYLNLAADASRHRLLTSSDLTLLLSALPSTLRSLNINGARINPSHISALRMLAGHVEELGLRGAQLSLASDIKPLLKQPHAIRYLDLADIKSVTQMSLSYSPSSLTDTDTLPLEVIELGQDVLGEIKRRNAHVKKPDWVVKELGRRGWFVRQPVAVNDNTSEQEKAQGQVEVDDGSRSWKMGARWWGMRKIPVVEQDVGGMYGYFMFKRS